MLNSTFSLIEEITSRNIQKLKQDYMDLNQRALTSEEEQLFDQLQEASTKYKRAFLSNSRESKSYKNEVHRLNSKIGKLLNPKVTPAQLSSKTVIIEVPTKQPSGLLTNGHHVQASILDILKNTFNQDIKVLEGKELSDFIDQHRGAAEHVASKKDEKKPTKAKSKVQENIFTNYAEQVQDDRQRELFMQNSCNSRNPDLYYSKDEMDIILSQTGYLEATPLYISSLRLSSSKISRSETESNSERKRNSVD